MNIRSRVNRRSFVRSGTALALGCGMSAWQLREGTAAPWKRGEPVRLVGSVNGLASLDPALSRDLDSNFMLRQVFRGLMALDADLVPQPELAESMEVMSDGLTYTFRLRPEARFHDGRAITAQDVADSFARALSPGRLGVNPVPAMTYLSEIVGADAVMTGESDTVSGIELVDDRTVVITLRAASATFPMKLASLPASIVDAGQTGDPDWQSAPNGSGPFAVTTWSPRELLALAPAETWWNGAPVTGVVTFRLGTSASQPLNLWQAGELDLLPDVQAQVQDLVEDPGSKIVFGEIIETQVFATSYIALGNQVAPLDDIHVRRALQKVFPANRVAEATLDGSALVAQGLIPPGMVGEAWAVEPVPVDVEAAREELALSRYGSAEAVPPITIAAADIDAVAALAEVAQESLGMRVEAMEVPWGAFMTGLTQREFAAYGLYWGADYPDPESMVDMLFRSDAGDNYTGYRNDQLDDLLVAARAADRVQRIDLYRQANQLLIDDAAIMPLFHPKSFTLVREGLAGVQVTPMGVLKLETIHDG